MPLLLDTDYVKLEESGLAYVEDEANRFLVLADYPLQDGLYHEERCDVLVVIPKNYNHAGIDMFWTHPHLTRIDGNPIPRTNVPGDRHNHTFDGKEFCRWSRHWNHAPSVWKAGKDNIDTILHRITWGLGHPDSK